MKKYEPLRRFLRRRRDAAEPVQLSFDDIERIISDLLPKAATRAEWWASGGKQGRAHAQSITWLEAGFEAELIPGRESVRFLPRQPGGAEARN